MEINKKEILILGGILGLLIFYRQITKSKSKKEKKSSFIGSPFGKRVMFTLKNNTDSNQVVPLFNSYSNIQNPNVSISPSIAEFNRTLLNEPKIIKTIEIRASGNKAQAENPIQIQCKDASGEFKGKLIYPLISANQVAQDITTVHPKNFIASGECYLNYTVKPKQTVILVFHYDTEKVKKNIKK